MRAGGEIATTTNSAGASRPRSGASELAVLSRRPHYDGITVCLGIAVGTRLHDAEQAQLDHDLTTLRRRLARAFLSGDTAEITCNRAEIAELEGRRAQNKALSDSDFTWRARRPQGTKFSEP